MTEAKPNARRELYEKLVQGIYRRAKQTEIPKNMWIVVNRDDVLRIAADPTHPLHATAVEITKEWVPRDEVPPDAIVYGEKK